MHAVLKCGFKYEWKPFHNECVGLIDNPKVSFLRIHRSILLVSLLLVTSIAVSLYFGSFKSRATQSTTISYPIELSCALENASVGLKENLTVEFTLRNVSNQTITLKKPYMWPTTSIHSRYYSTTYGGANITQPSRNVSSLFHFGVAFACSNGTIIFEAIHGILTASYLISLEPNGYIEQTMLLDIGLDNLQAGNYEIRAIFDYYAPGVHGLNALETPSITVTVG